MSDTSLDLFERVVRARGVAYSEWTPGEDRIYASPALAALFDLDPEDWTVQRLMDHIHPDDAAGYRAGLTAFMKSDADRAEIAVRYRRRNGGMSWILNHNYAERDPSGRVTRLTTTSTDITQEKERDAENRALLARQAASVEVLKAITASPDDPQPVFELIVRRACELCNAQAGNLVEYDGTLMHQRILRGFAPEAEARLRAVFPRPPGLDTLPGRVVLTGQRIHLPDAQADQGLIQQGRGLGARAFLGVPLLREGQVIGVLGLAHFDPGEYDQSAIELVQSFAEQAVIAIAGAKTLRELRDRTAELAERNDAYSERIEHQSATIDVLKAMSASPGDAQPVFDLICQQANTLLGTSTLGTSTVGLFEYDGELVHYRSTSSLADIAGAVASAAFASAWPKIPDRGSLTCRAILDGRVVHVRDLTTDPSISRMVRDLGHRSQISVPLLRDGRVIGAISMGSRECGGFSDTQVDLLKTFAEQAVIAISSAETYRALQSRTAELQRSIEYQAATTDVLKVMSSSAGDTQPVFEIILRHAMTLCDGRYGGLWEYDGELVHLRAVGGHSPAMAAAAQAAYPKRLSGANVGERAMLEGQPIHVRDYLAEPDIGQTFRDMDHRSIIAVPLLRDGVVIGAISVGSRHVDGFSQAHLELLKTFAEQAVIAIGTTATFRALQARTADLQESLEYQTATGEVLKVISRSTFDLQPVLSTLVETAARLCDAEQAVINRREGATWRFEANFGFPPEFEAYVRSHGPMSYGPDAPSVAARAARERRPVHIHDVAVVPGYPDVSITLGKQRTSLGVPLMREGEVIGTIVLARQRVEPFTSRQIDLVSTFADQAVIAIENTRLLTEQREALEQQTATAEVLQVINASPGDLTPVFDAMLEKAMRLCGGSFGMFNTFDGESFRSAATRGLPAAYEAFRTTITFQPEPQQAWRNVPAVAECLDTRRPVQVLDLKAEDSYRTHAGVRGQVDLGGARTVLLTPLVKDSTVLGVIAIYRQEVRAFTGKEIALLENFATQAVIAMENARLFGELRQRTDDLQESLTYQTATGDVLKAISRSTFDLGPVLDTVVETAARLCDADMAFIFRRYGDIYRLVSNWGFPPEFEAFLKTQSLAPGRGSVTQRTAFEGRVVHIHDMAADPEYALPKWEMAHVRTGLGVPLLRDGAMAGVIALARRDVRPFTERQIELVGTFADQAVIAIENTRLLTEQREALEQQTATAEVLGVINASPGDLMPVFDAILEKAHKLCGAVMGALITYDGEHLRGVATHGYPEDIAALMLQPFRPAGVSRDLIDGERLIHIADLTLVESRPEGRVRILIEHLGARALLGVPLRKDGIYVGQISAYRTEARSFSEKEIALLENFAAQAVIAMENARLINEQRDALERQTATAEVLEVINASAGNLAPVFDVILEKALRICQPAFGTLNAFDGDKVVFLADRGTSADLAEYRAKHPGDGLSANVIRMRETRRSVHLLDIREGEAYRAGHAGPRAVADLGGARTLLLVPLLKEQAVVGSLQIYRREVRAFTDNEISLLENFAAQAVIAMENARLINEQREALEQQTATAEVLGVINASPGDLVPVFDVILEKAHKLCGVALGALLTADGDVVQAVATRGYSAELDAFVREPMPLAPLNRLARDRGERVYQIADISTDEATMGSDVGRSFVELTGTRTYLSVLLWKDDVLVGLISAFRTEVRPFTSKEIALLQNFAAQAVIAMENARLINEQREALEQQTATAEVLQVINASPGNLMPVFNSILAKSMHLCEAAFGALYTYDGEHLRPEATQGLPGALVDYHGGNPTQQPPLLALQVIETRRPILVLDLREGEGYRSGHPGTLAVVDLGGARTVLLVPLLKEQSVVGFIQLYRQEVRAFTDKQIALLRNFAGQAVIAMENARLITEQREALEQQTATAEVLQVINASPGNLQPVFDTMLEKAMRLLGAAYGMLNTYDGRTLPRAAARGVPPAYEEFASRYREQYGIGEMSAPVRQLVETRQLVHILDLREDASYRTGDILMRALVDIAGARTNLWVPLVKDDILLGVIAVYRQEVRAFSGKEIALLENFAAQAVIAMESARLLNELRARTDELAQRQAELHVTFENMGDGVAMFDQAQRLVAWNRRFQDLLDVPDDIIAQRRSLPEYVRYLAERGEFGTDADVDEQVRRVLHTTGQMRVFERVRPNGSVIEVHSNPIAGGGFVLIYSDITERKRNEEAIGAARDAAEEASHTIEAAFRELKTAQANLIQAEKMASLGQLTAGIAHEIKNPLNFVNNFAILSVELLSELREGIATALALLTEDQRADVEETVGMLTSNLEKITEHGKRADGIVKAMLEHSRGESGERRTVDINVLADEALNLAYHGARAQDQSFDISLERDFGGEISPIEVNPQDMTRVFLNLFSNGFYAANRRQRNGADDFRPTLKVTTRTVGDAVEIRVRDNGTGISADIKDKLFQPFFTTKPTGEGTGLGLSITYDIVTKAHGGTIAVDSEVDEFTEFVVTLPRGMFSNEGSHA